MESSELYDLDYEIFDDETPADALNSVEQAVNLSDADEGEENDLNEEQVAAGVEVTVCAICLNPLLNRTVLPLCFHEFCHTCILSWSAVSRACPLCKTLFSECLHSFRGNNDFVRYRFPPLDSTTLPKPPPFNARRNLSNNRSSVQLRLKRTRTRASGSETEEERQRRLWVDGRLRDGAEFLSLDEMDRRRFVYRHKLFAKHVGVNLLSGYKWTVTPELFRRDQALRARFLPWLRRELRVLLRDEDIELIKDFVMAVMEKFEVQSHSAIELIRPYILGKTEHFVHEIVSFLRSPYDTDTWDKFVQYDEPRMVLDVGEGSSGVSAVEGGSVDAVPDQPTKPVENVSLPPAREDELSTESLRPRSPSLPRSDRMVDAEEEPSRRLPVSDENRSPRSPSLTRSQRRDDADEMQSRRSSKSDEQNLREGSRRSPRQRDRSDSRSRSRSPSRRRHRRRQHRESGTRRRRRSSSRNRKRVRDREGDDFDRSRSRSRSRSHRRSRSRSQSRSRSRSMSRSRSHSRSADRTRSRADSRDSFSPERGVRKDRVHRNRERRRNRSGSRRRRSLSQSRSRSPVQKRRSSESYVHSNYRGSRFQSRAGRSRRGFRHSRNHHESWRGGHFNGNRGGFGGRDDYENYYSGYHEHLEYGHDYSMEEIYAESYDGGFSILGRGASMAAAQSESANLNNEDEVRRLRALAFASLKKNRGSSLSGEQVVDGGGGEERAETFKVAETSDKADGETADRLKELRARLVRSCEERRKREALQCE